MFKAMILTRRRPDLDPQAFKDRYVNHHAAIVARTPGLRRYVQHIVLPGADGREPEVSGIAEVSYDDAAAFRAAMASPVAAEANASLATFTDTNRMQVFVVEEIPVL
jgi:uncharacterized protein (TIGR02118 family)